MATTNINVRVDAELKQEAEELFEVKRNIPNSETIAALAEYKEMKKKTSKYKRYNSFDELMDEALSDVEIVPAHSRDFSRE